MMLIRSNAGVAPTLTGAVNLLVVNEIVPALQRTIGQGLILPDMIHLVSGSDADGRVPGRINPTTGEVVSLDTPVICATEKRDLLRYVLVHELAHYHELSLRKTRGIRVPGVGPTQLWSEYFAQRVSWESGVVSAETLLAGGGEGVVEQSLPQNDKGEAYSFAYMLTFVLAHADAVPNWLDAYPGKEDRLRATVGVLHTGGAAKGLFGRFPGWTKADAALATMLFKGLLKLGRLGSK